MIPKHNRLQSYNFFLEPANVFEKTEQQNPFFINIHINFQLIFLRNIVK